jgi:predicted ribosomally synthesized peptide with nif11-like leader
MTTSKPPPNTRGLQSALRFIALVRENPALQGRLAELGPDAGLSAVTQLAADAGFAFTDRDLRAAHAHDWGLREAVFVGSSPIGRASDRLTVRSEPSLT